MKLTPGCQFRIRQLKQWLCATYLTLLPSTLLFISHSLYIPTLASLSTSLALMCLCVNQVQSSELNAYEVGWKQLSSQEYKRVQMWKKVNRSLSEVCTNVWSVLAQTDKLSKARSDLLSLSLSLPSPWIPHAKIVFSSSRVHGFLWIVQAENSWSGTQWRQSLFPVCIFAEDFFLLSIHLPLSAGLQRTVTVI